MKSEPFFYTCQIMLRKRNNDVISLSFTLVRRSAYLKAPNGGTYILYISVVCAIFVELR